MTRASQNKWALRSTRKNTTHGSVDVYLVSVSKTGVGYWSVDPDAAIRFKDEPSANLKSSKLLRSDGVITVVLP